MLISGGKNGKEGEQDLRRLTDVKDQGIVLSAIFFVISCIRDVGCLQAEALCHGHLDIFGKQARIKFLFFSGMINREEGDLQAVDGLRKQVPQRKQVRVFLTESPSYGIDPIVSWVSDDDGLHRNARTKSPRLELYENLAIGICSFWTDEELR